MQSGVELTEKDFEFISYNVPDEYNDTCAKIAAPVWSILIDALLPLRGDVMEYFRNNLSEDKTNGLKAYNFSFSIFMASRVISIATGKDELARCFIKALVMLTDTRRDLFPGIDFIRRTVSEFEETELMFSKTIKVRNILSSYDKVQIGNILSSIFINTLNHNQTTDLIKDFTISHHLEGVYREIFDIITAALGGRVPTPAAIKSNHAHADTPAEATAKIPPVILSQTTVAAETPKTRSDRSKLLIALLTACTLLIATAFTVYVTTRPDDRPTEESIKAAILESLRAETPERVGISDIAKKILPSTVTITIDTGNPQGSGFFVNNSGDILTNYHVIEDASEITIITNDKKEYTAAVRSFNKARDMALLSSGVPSAESLPLAITGNIPEIGSEVVVAGAPRGFAQTVSNGIVSATRELDNDGVTFLQITAPISPGSSGGPVVNMNGEVVGISTIIRIDAQNVNFAVSSIYFTSFINQAVKMPPAKPAAKKETPPRKPDPVETADDSLVFVSKDLNYTIYLRKNLVLFNFDDDRAYIWTMWIPSEEQRTRVADALNLTSMPLGNFELNYVIDMKSGMGAHIRTINFYKDGSVARDYKVPELKWETPETNKRIDAFFTTLHRIGTQKDPGLQIYGIDVSAIPLPDDSGFMGHAWASNLKELKKKLPEIKNIGDSKGVEVYSTFKCYKVFNRKSNAFVFYAFHDDILSSIMFLILDHPSNSTMTSIIGELNAEFGEYVPKNDDGTPTYYWEYGDLDVSIEDPMSPSPEKSIIFSYYPLTSQYE